MGDSDEEQEWNELLTERGPLVEPKPAAFDTKQLENAMKYLYSRITLNEKALKRAQNARKKSVMAERKATIALQMGNLPGSRPGTPGQPAAPPPPTDSAVFTEKWTGAGDDVNEKLNSIFEMLIKTMKNVDQIKDDMAHSAAIQAAKDDAQDEVMQMEFDSYDRKLANVLKYKDLSEAVNVMDSQMKSIEANLKRNILDSRRQVTSEIDEELERVLNQVKGVIEATEEQDKLLDERVQRLVEKEITSPTSHVTKETVIIQQQHEKQAAQDHTAIHKLKASVNKMELEHANSQNLMERLAASCEAATKRARESEDIAKKAQEEIVLATSSLNEQLHTTLNEQINTVTTSMLEANAAIETMVNEQKASSEETVQQNLAVLTGKLKEEIKQVAETTSQNLQLVTVTTREQFKTLETKQEEVIRKMVQETEEDNAHDEIEERRRMLAEIAELKAEIAELKATKEKEKDDIQNETKNMHETLRRQSMAQVQLVSTQMNTKNTEFTNRIEEMTSIQHSTKIGVKALQDNINDITKKLHQSIEGLKKENKDNTVKAIETTEKVKLNLSSAIADLDERLQKQAQSLEDEVQNFSDENIAIQGTIADLNDDLNKLATKAELWDIIEAKLDHHVKTLGKECTELEESVSSSTPTVLSMHLQRYLAGNTQRIAKLLATKADFEVIRKIVTHTDPATVDWDDEVNVLRNKFRNEFLVRVKEEAHKKHPITDMLIDEARDKFMMKLDLAVKVAISKFTRVQVGTTLLGRRQLVPTCMACDRPFNPNGGNGGDGDTRGVSQDPLPQNIRDDDSSIASYTSITDGSRNSNNYQVVPFGVDQRKLDKYVFRAGFKIPKHISSPLIVNSNALSEGFYDDEASIGSQSSLGSLSRGGNRPHTVAGRSGKNKYVGRSPKKLAPVERSPTRS